LIWIASAACTSVPERPGDETEVVDLPRQELVFARHSDPGRRDYDIWRMCGDGTQMASLVTEPGNQVTLTVSPDGDELVYTSVTEGQRDLWRRRFDDPAAVNLTDHPAEDSQPAWGPDGRIAFFSDRDTERLELYLLDLSDGTVQRLTHNDLYDSGAAWAPDGSSILFTRFFPEVEGSEESGHGEVIRLDLATGEERQLTELGGYNGGLSYSPDGRQVAFHRAADGGSELWIMNSDGSEPRALTDTFIDEYSPAWSPDGRWIAFAAGVGNDAMGTFDLWIMRPDGSRRQVLSTAANTEMEHHWRPGEHYCRGASGAGAGESEAPGFGGHHARNSRFCSSLAATKGPGQDRCGGRRAPGFLHGCRFFSQFLFAPRHVLTQVSSCHHWSFPRVPGSSAQGIPCKWSGGGDGPSSC
jgi:TolB protein